MTMEFLGMTLSFSRPRVARFALVLAPLLLAACGDRAGDKTGSAADPVAAVAAPAGKNWTEEVVKVGLGYRMGNPDAPIKLVEYGARSCPGCGAFANSATRTLEEKYVASGKVSYEFHDFLVHGAQDLPGAMLGQCGGSAAFFPLLEGMYQNQRDYLDRLQAMPQADQDRLKTATPTQAVTILAEIGGLIDFVKQRGIPEAKARQCLGDEKLLEELAKTTDQLGKDGRVTGTPTFYLNDERVPAGDWPSVEAALKAAGA